MKNYEIVLARHNEPLKWLRFLPPIKKREYSIYLSNSGEETFNPFVDKEVLVDNIGREAGHYLQYIVKNYDTLSPVTVFIQANPWQHFSESTECLLDLFFGNPTFRKQVCYIGENDTGLGLPIEKHSLKEKILRAGWGDLPIPKSIKMAVGGQFYVKKETILKRPKDHYQAILNTAEWEGISLAHCLEPHWASVFDYEKQ